MKIRTIAAMLCFGWLAGPGYAQAPAPTAPAEPSATPAAPATPATPPSPNPPPPAAPPKTNIVEGTLFKTQRANSDKGTFVWVCTYNVAGSKRAVQLDESCPSTMVFEIRR